MPIGHSDAIPLNNCVVIFLGAFLSDVRFAVLVVGVVLELLARGMCVGWVEDDMVELIFAVRQLLEVIRSLGVNQIAPRHSGA